jgi:hypothetical protein
MFFRPGTAAAMSWSPCSRRSSAIGPKGSTPSSRAFLILTDASGPFFTVVTEMEIESFAAWPQFMAEEFALPQFADWFHRMAPLVESGRREFYNVVE